ncbi:sensor histidine kinase KdpD [Pseudophaeobacter sp. EL27]|uniref:sensor histidine kinase n=1 Tax=Pseudophaeobacter sp. EL27 TaxID=2107580 RepID=UPI000EFCBC87|nr:HAMP domain-containing sensor histidine kinase [Pseudophaeobacter sp. EL27]
MRAQLVQKWRPTLALVLGGGLAGTLILSLIGLVALRYLGPEIGFRNAALLLGTLILLATSFLGWLLVRLLLSPIRALNAYAAQTRSHPGQTIDPPEQSGTVELHNMARNVVDMAEHLRNREMTIRSFTDHVSHEIKTPVSAIRAAAELIEDGGALSADDQKLLTQIDGAARQIEEQLTALREVARAREMSHQGSSKIDALSNWLRQEFADLGLSLSGTDLLFPIGESGLKIILAHLLNNARDQGAQRVDITARLQPTGLELRVSDDGPGISPGNAAQIFDPFFTTKRAKGGTGMGLTILRNMLSVHGGDISLHPSKRGACFVISFAAAPSR